MSCNTCCGLQKYGNGNVGKYSEMNRTEFDKQMQAKWCPDCQKLQPTFCGGDGVCEHDLNFMFGDEVSQEVKEGYCGGYGGCGGCGCGAKYGGSCSCGGNCNCGKYGADCGCGGAGKRGGRGGYAGYNTLYY